jgi:phosphoesterase family protein
MCPDHKVREPEWAREFRKFVQNGNLPELEIVYLPNDHTEGTVPRKATPPSYMADNDLALGRLVQAVSHSPYWASTAIFVLEDDSQDGPDHVDAHRSVALVISPYTQHATVDSTHYDTASMLATIERLLGLSPMSTFDLRATPMWKAFGPRPDMRPYDAIRPTAIPFGDPGYPRKQTGRSSRVAVGRPGLLSARRRQRRNTRRGDLGDDTWDSTASLTRDTLFAHLRRGRQPRSPSWVGREVS